MYAFHINMNIKPQLKFKKQQIEKTEVCEYEKILGNISDQINVKALLKCQTQYSSVTLVLTRHDIRNNKTLFLSMYCSSIRYSNQHFRLYSFVPKSPLLQLHKLPFSLLCCPTYDGQTLQSFTPRQCFYLLFTKIAAFVIASQNLWGHRLVKISWHLLRHVPLMF